jgi:Fic family protein
MPRTPPDYDATLKKVARDPAKIRQVLTAHGGPLQAGKYRHWDEIIYLTPPEGLTHEEWWTGVKLSRGPLLKKLPFVDTNGQVFTLGMPDPALAMTHVIDRDASGQIEISEEVTNPATRERYVVNSLIEEAITSSQLEGAATTGKVAKEMIRSGRKPRDKSERMIVNDYRAMQFIRQVKGRKLSPEMIFELHRLVTDETLEAPDAAGRLRRKDEAVAVFDPRDNTLLHDPPDADLLPARLVALCDFANGRTPNYFIHPVARAIVLHFWLGYDHPFVDGNGRTARAVFYWSMLHQGYWLAEYLSISSILKKGPAKYMRAYVYTETDEADVTYFLLFQLKVIIRAITELQGYLERKMTEFRQTSALLRRSDRFNHRQIALLGHALRHPSAHYTIQSHKTSHNVVYQTARADLLDLARAGLLDLRKVRRVFYFVPHDDLAVRLKGVPKGGRAAAVLSKQGRKPGKASS